MIRMSIIVLFLAVFAQKGISCSDRKPVSISNGFYDEASKSHLLIWMNSAGIDQDDTVEHYWIPASSSLGLQYIFGRVESEVFLFGTQWSRLFFRRWLVFCQQLN